MSQESGKTDRIILSVQPVAREWRRVVEQISGLIDQGNAIMLNAELAEEERTGKKNRSFMRPQITSGDSKLNFLMNQLSWWTGDGRATVKWDNKKSVILTDDGNGRFIDEEVNSGTFETMGVGGLIQVRIVDDLDSRVLNWDKNIYRDPMIGRLYICGDYELRKYLRKGWEKGVDQGPLKIISFPFRDDELAVSVIQIRQKFGESVQPKVKKRFRFF